MKLKFTACKMLLLSFVILSPSGFLSSKSFAADGSGSHGGDGIYILFDEARIGLGSLFKHLDDRKIAQVEDTELREWILKNKAQLADDIRQSEHKWVTEEQSTCAKTDVSPRATIQLSVPACQKGDLNIQDVAMILIHESAHHLGVDNEDFATKVASSIIVAAHDFQVHSDEDLNLNTWLDLPSGLTFTYIGRLEFGQAHDSACAQRLGAGWFLPEYSDNPDAVFRLLTQSHLRKFLFATNQQQPFQQIWTRSNRLMRDIMTSKLYNVPYRHGEILEEAVLCSVRAPGTCAGPTVCVQFP